MRRALAAAARGGRPPARLASTAAEAVPSSSSSLSVYEFEGLRVIELSRVEELNSLDMELAGELNRMLAKWEDNAMVSSVVLRGDQGCFCGGTDLDWLRMNRDAAPELYGALADLYLRISTYRKPVVSLASGTIAGGGLGLANTPFSVATEKTTFSVSEPSFGLVPDGSVLHMLANADKESGVPVGRYLALTGAPIIGADMARFSLLPYFVPDVSLDDLVAQLSSLSSLSSARQPDLRRALTLFSEEGPNTEGLELADLPPSLLADEVAHSGGEAEAWTRKETEAVAACFAHNSVEAIWSSLEARSGSSEWARSTLEQMSRAHPAALKATLRLMDGCARRPLSEAVDLTIAVAARISNESGFDGAIAHAENGTAPEPITLKDLDQVPDESIDALFK
mmetsp:Transcript_103379/g.297064  ORF Transcript_103379/g.297064 Transcript_103379/m.297064 type:complete len:396 (-) Transcript_103379:228-1415(-)